jgi:8-oxo-dGTP pyrophosphatase MutT (NUDIX family)
MHGTGQVHTTFSPVMYRAEKSLFSPSHVVAVGPWRCKDVECISVLSPGNGERTTRDYIDALWTAFKKRHPSAFDGPMLGLVGIQSCTARRLRLGVKRTGYAEYVATRSPAFANEHPEIERANPIGLTIIVVSADNKCVITQRSPSVDQNPGMAYFIGGYLEPPSDGDLTGLVCRNATREINEELGLAGGGALITGMALDPHYCHPELFAVSRVAHRSADIAEAWRSALDSDEASRLLFRPMRETISASAGQLLGAGMTWSFRAATHLLRRCWGQVTPMLDSR